MPKLNHSAFKRYAITKLTLVNSHPNPDARMRGVTKCLQDLILKARKHNITYRKPPHGESLSDLELVNLFLEGAQKRNLRKHRRRAPELSSRDTIELPTHKLCTSCLLELPYHQFHRDWPREDGHCNTCKACRKTIPRPVSLNTQVTRLQTKIVKLQKKQMGILAKANQEASEIEVQTNELRKQLRSLT